MPTLGSPVVVVVVVVVVIAGSPPLPPPRLASRPYTSGRRYCVRSDLRAHACAEETIERHPFLSPFFPSDTSLSPSLPPLAVPPLVLSLSLSLFVHPSICLSARSPARCLSLSLSLFLSPLSRSEA